MSADCPIEIPKEMHAGANVLDPTFRLVRRVNADPKERDAVVVKSVSVPQHRIDSAPSCGIAGRTKKAKDDVASGEGVDSEIR